MGYEGGKLAPLFDDGPTQQAVMRMADKGGDRMVEWTVINTPIGGRDLIGQGAGGHGGGNLKTSWYQKALRRTRRAGVTGWESGVATDVDYAPHVEHGTGLWGPDHAEYEIKPKKPGGWLHWIDPKTGKDVFAKRVMHPGSPGQHMVAIAATMVEHEMSHGLFDAILEQWKLETEALAG